MAAVERALICPACGAAVKLPNPAVRLTGRIACPNNHVVEYDWRRYYHGNGALKKSVVKEG